VSRSTELQSPTIEHTFEREETTVSVIDVPVMVWTDDNGVPERLVWGTHRYRVSDTPTLLEPDVSFITHPPALPPMWRFQGTDEDGDVRVFDVKVDLARQQWQLLRTYQ
jgi:hypothetical protein